jgi:hypothetical protein
LGYQIPFGFQFPYSLNLQMAPSSGVTGQGTVSVSGYLLTGVGSVFTQQLQPGSTIVDSSGHYATVIAVNSDTSAQILPTGGSGTLSGSFNVIPPLLTLGNTASSNYPAIFMNAPISASTNYASKMVFTPNSLVLVNPVSSAAYTAWIPYVSSTGQLIFSNPSYTASNNVAFDQNTPSYSLHVTITGVGTVGGFGSSATQTTVSGSTAGTATFSEPLNGSSEKKVMIYCSNTFSGTASYTFPLAFTNIPSPNQISLPSGVTASAISTAAITLTGTGSGNGGGSVDAY